MLRQPRFFILACFLVAIASNFIQATRISVNQATSAERLLSGGTTSERDSAFIVSDDDNSGDTPVLVLTQTTIENIPSAFLSFRLNLSTAITAAQAERNYTVLRL